MTKDESLELAAWAWCQPKTKNTVMDVDLAEAFAAILYKEVNKAECRGQLRRGKQPNYWEAPE